MIPNISYIYIYVSCTIYQSLCGGFTVFILISDCLRHHACLWEGATIDHITVYRSVEHYYARPVQAFDPVLLGRARFAGRVAKMTCGNQMS